MYAFVAATLASAVLVSAQSGLTINTPSSVVQCQPAAIAWTGGTGPYFLSIIPGGQPGAAALETFPEATTNSFTWSQADIAAGTAITFQIRDSTGTLAYTDVVTVQAGSSSTCVGSGSSSGSAAGAAGTPTASGAAPPAGATTGTSSAGGRPAASGASAPAPAASGSSAPSSGAEKVGAGVVGVAVAAIFAAFA